MKERRDRGVGVKEGREDEGGGGLKRGVEEGWGWVGGSGLSSCPPGQGGGRDMWESD